MSSSSPFCAELPIRRPTIGSPVSRPGTMTCARKASLSRFRRRPSRRWSSSRRRQAVTSVHCAMPSADARASLSAPHQDLQAASWDRMRLDAYLSEVKVTSQTDPNSLKEQGGSLGAQPWNQDQQGVLRQAARSAGHLPLAAHRGPGHGRLQCPDARRAADRRARRPT